MYAMQQTLVERLTSPNNLLSRVSRCNCVSELLQYTVNVFLNDELCTSECVVLLYKLSVYACLSIMNVHY